MIFHELSSFIQTQARPKSSYELRWPAAYPNALPGLDLAEFEQPGSGIGSIGISSGIAVAVSGFVSDSLEGMKIDSLHNRALAALKQTYSEHLYHNWPP